MVRHVDAIFSEGAFRPLEPLSMAEGTRVHLSVEDATNGDPGQPVATIHSPKLAHVEDAADFVIEIRENGNAGISAVDRAELARRTDEALKPVRDAFVASGMTDDELAELLEVEKHAARGVPYGTD